MFLAVVVVVVIISKVHNEFLSGTHEMFISIFEKEEKTLFVNFGLIIPINICHGQLTSEIDKIYRVFEPCTQLSTDIDSNHPCHEATSGALEQVVGKNQ